MNSVCSVNPRPRTRTLLSKGSSNEKRSGVYGAETRRADSRAESRELRRAESTGTARKTRPKRCAQASARAPRLVQSPRCSLALRLQATLPYTHTLQLPACRLRAPHSRGAFGAANRTRRKPFKLRPPPSCFHTTTCSTTPSRSALHLVPTEKHRRQRQHPDISHPDSHDA